MNIDLTLQIFSITSWVKVIPHFAEFLIFSIDELTVNCIIFNCIYLYFRIWGYSHLIRRKWDMKNLRTPFLFFIWWRILLFKYIIALPYKFNINIPRFFLSFKYQAILMFFLWINDDHLGLFFPDDLKLFSILNLLT